MPDFKWRFPDHFYLYLAMRELEGEGAAVTGNRGPIALTLPAEAHAQYEAYCDIRLAPPDIDATTVGDQDHEEEGDEQPAPPACGGDSGGCDGDGGDDNGRCDGGGCDGGACDGGDTCARYPSLVIGCWQILERDADALPTSVSLIGGGVEGRGELSTPTGPRMVRGVTVKGLALPAR